MSIRQVKTGNDARKVRRTAGVTQQAVADALGVSPSWVGRREQARQVAREDAARIEWAIRDARSAKNPAP